MSVTVCEGSKFLSLYTSTLLLVRVSQNNDLLSYESSYRFTKYQEINLVRFQLIHYRQIFEFSL
jgi:hypothetical protein